MAYFLPVLEGGHFWSHGNRPVLRAGTSRTFLFKREELFVESGVVHGLIPLSTSRAASR